MRAETGTARSKKSVMRGSTAGRSELCGSFSFLIWRARCGFGGGGFVATGLDGGVLWRRRIWWRRFSLRFGYFFDLIAPCFTPFWVLKKVIIPYLIPI